MCILSGKIHREEAGYMECRKLIVDKKTSAMYNANKLQQNKRRVDEKSTFIKDSTESCRLVRGAESDNGKYISEQ